MFVAVGGVYWPVPVGKSHHDVEGGQEEHEVEERVAVLDHVSLVVLHTPGPTDHPTLWLVRSAGIALGQDDGIVRGHGQLIHLAGVGGADTAQEEKKEKKCLLNPRQ